MIYATAYIMRLEDCERVWKKIREIAQPMTEADTEENIKLILKKWKSFGRKLRMTDGLQWTQQNQTDYALVHYSNRQAAVWLQAWYEQMINITTGVEFNLQQPCKALIMLYT